MAPKKSRYRRAREKFLKYKDFAEAADLSRKRESQALRRLSIKRLAQSLSPGDLRKNLLKLASANTKKRVEAITFLGEEKNIAGFRPLLLTLKDSEAGVRLAAIRALGKYGSDKAVPQLAAILIYGPKRDGKEREVATKRLRKAALDSLNKIKSDQAIPAFKKLLETEKKDLSLKADCIHALKGLDKKKVFPVLVARLKAKEEDLSIRGILIQALGEIGSVRALPVLKKLAAGEVAGIFPAKKEEKGKLEICIINPAREAVKKIEAQG